MPRRKISDLVQAQVRRRAKQLCEYCHASEKWQYVRFTVDHINPIDSGGSDGLNNLALACFHCNRRKSNYVSGTDPESGQEVALFNPRQDHWAGHFIWSPDGLLILGLTQTGRATIATLDLNRDRVINIREADKEVGRHPPDDDPMQTLLG